MNEFTRLLDDVTNEVATIGIGVKVLHQKKKLDQSRLKLFYTVLKRTKGYIEAAKDHVGSVKQKEKGKIWNALWGEGAPD